MEDRILPTGSGESVVFMGGNLGEWVAYGYAGHAGAGLQAGEQKGGHLRARAEGAHLDVLLLEWETKDSILWDPASLCQCMLIEYLSCARHCAWSREAGWLRPHLQSQ